jgi:membrane protease YdiL (CAAX protease family)
MVTRLTNVNPVQLGVVYGVLYGLIGIVLALVMMPFFALMSTLGSHYGRGTDVPAIGMAGVLVSLIVFPILYGVLGFVAGIIGGLVYNLVAGWTGGIEVTLTQVAATENVPATV